MGYLSWNEQTITDFSEASVNAQYNQGYVFTRKGKGVMNQTRSLRIDLSKFELSSENRRILKKTDGLEQAYQPLPLQEYHWTIGKIAKDFYDTKFGPGTFSANKVKELLTDPEKSNFNELLTYTYSDVDETVDPESIDDSQEPIGYVICYETRNIYHYSYPFYKLNSVDMPLPPNIGMAMMLGGIMWAQHTQRKYIYLGSAQRPTDTYKLQFAGLEWWDGREWQTDLEKLKLELGKKI